MLAISTATAEFTTPVLIIVFGYLLSLLLIPVAVLLKKQEPVSTVAWILTIAMLPYLGGLLFLVFGINRVKRRALQKRKSTHDIAEQFSDLVELGNIPKERLTPFQDALERIARRIAGTTCTSGNQIELLTDTNRTFGLLEQAIRSAKESLHLEYYIWRPDRTGTRLRNLLIQKASEGVQIRFLYDGFGSLFLSNRFLQPMRSAGIQVASFLPGWSLRERWSLNLRNHRKIVIVDGQTGFTGGMNIGDEYLGKNPNVGYWRDTHLKLFGPAVLQLQRIFAEDWYYATGEDLTGVVQPKRFTAQKSSEHDVVAHVLAGAPHGNVRVLQTLIFMALNAAQEQVHLATSYFAPPESLVAALEAAAYRGVKVRILLAGPPCHLWSVLAARSYYDSLLRAGVEIHEYRKGMLHSKTLCVDGAWCLVGSPNFDTRSLALNFEAAVAIYDQEFAAKLDQQFLRDLLHAIPIDQDAWRRRSLPHVFAENICRLFTPVL